MGFFGGFFWLIVLWILMGEGGGREGGRGLDGVRDGGREGVEGGRALFEGSGARIRGSGWWRGGVKRGGEKG